MDSDLWHENTNLKAMDLLLQCYLLVLTKKVPSEIGVNKIDTLHNKVKLLPPVNKDSKPDAAVLRITNIIKRTSALNVSSETDTTAYALAGRI